MNVLTVTSVTMNVLTVTSVTMNVLTVTSVTMNVFTVTSVTMNVFTVTSVLSQQVKKEKVAEEKQMVLYESGWSSVTPTQPQQKKIDKRTSNEKLPDEKGRVEKLPEEKVTDETEKVEEVKTSLFSRAFANTMETVVQGLSTSFKEKLQTEKNTGGQREDNVPEGSTAAATEERFTTIPGDTSVERKSLVAGEAQSGKPQVKAEPPNQKVPLGKLLISQTGNLFKAGQPTKGGQVAKTQPTKGGQVAKTQPIKVVQAAKTQPTKVVQVAKTQPTKGGQVAKTQPIKVVQAAKTQPTKVVQVAKFQTAKMESAAKVEPVVKTQSDTGGQIVKTQPAKSQPAKIGSVVKTQSDTGGQVAKPQPAKVVEDATTKFAKEGQLIEEGKLAVNAVDDESSSK